MSSSDAMFEGPSVYFQYVNERTAYVKIDRSKSPNFSLFDGFRLQGFCEWMSKGFGSIRMIFQYFCKIFVQRSEEPPLRLCLFSRFFQKCFQKLFSSVQ